MPMAHTDPMGVTALLSGFENRTTVEYESKLESLLCAGFLAPQRHRLHVFSSCEGPLVVRFVRGSETRVEQTTRYVCGSLFSGLPSI